MCSVRMQAAPTLVWARPRVECDAADAAGNTSTTGFDVIVEFVDNIREAFSLLFKILLWGRSPFRACIL